MGSAKLQSEPVTYADIGVFQREWRGFSIEHRPDDGFGSNLYGRVGWLHITFSKYQDHRYFALMWARPLKAKPSRSERKGLAV